MKHRHFLAVVVLTVIGLAVGSPVGAQDQGEKKGDVKVPEKVEKAMAAVKEHLAKRGGEGAQILWKGEGALAGSFPDHLFVIARFRQYPVARQLPEGLSASNVFAVKDGKLQHLKDAKALEKFFKDNHPAVKGEKESSVILRAWLTLTQEYHQDGMFKFEVLEKEFAFADEGKTARGRAIVMQGGNGELAVTLTFDDGKLAKVKESAQIRPGPRPICQATKLLDPDPIVRRMAEQDLLIMGLAARDYLMEQRATASRELQAAIDRIWRQIQERGW